MLRLGSLRGLYRRRSLLVPRPLLSNSQLSVRVITNRPLIQEPPKNVLQRAQKFIRDNPYTKFSLSIVAILFGVSGGIELYRRMKAKRSPAVGIYPPKVGHLTIQRTELLDNIDSLVNKVKKQEAGPPVLYLTGDAGVGKSEVAHQYAVHFANNCTKWFGLRAQTPVILYINGTGLETLESTLREAAFGMGVQDKDLTLSSIDSPVMERLAILSVAVRSKLKEKKLPWLIIVDSLQSETVPGYKAVFLDELKETRNSVETEHVSWKDLDGVVVTIARKLDESLPQNSVLHIPKQMTSVEGLDLLSQLTGLDSKEEEIVQLLDSLHYHPLAISLCAATVKIYQSFVDSQPDPSSSNVITTYHELLKEQFSEDVLNTAMSLYFEAAVTDERFRHAFDLLGSCDLTRPLPVCVISRHLSSPFYQIPPESLAPPPVDAAIQMQKLTGINPNDASFFTQLKAMLPFGNSGPSTSDIAAVLATSEDPVSYLRECPLLSFKSYRRVGFEYVQVHQSSHDSLSSLFTKYTVPKLNLNGLANEEARFNRSTWFRSYRSFNPQQALVDFHRSLPGISEPGVLTRDDFDKLSSISTTTTGTKSSEKTTLDYLEYQHLVSHYHRVVGTLSDEVKAADNDAGDTLARRYLYPQIKYVSDYPHLSDTGRMLCLYDQTAIKASLSVSSFQESMAKLKQVLSHQKSMFGEKSQAVALTLVDMGNLNYSVNNLSEAKNFLESSLRVYGSITTKQATKNFPLEIGAAYSSLALVCSALNEKQRCKELLEQALAAYQTMPPEGVVSKRQRKLVCSCLTDVAHAYLSLGDVMMAKKYIDLSILAHKNLYLEGHPESVRALNVSSIVYSLLGDKPESARLRGEAGKQQAHLNAHPLVA